MASHTPAPLVDLLHGLEWRRSGLWTIPCWTVEPQVKAIEKIVCRYLDQPLACRVEFFGQGALNKLYRIQCNGHEYMLRVSLPVDPTYKTLSEVATLAFVRTHTNVPVARVIAFNASKDSDLGFEWILMERMAGAPLADSWREMSWMAKVGLVKQTARAIAQLFRHRLPRLGNLYHANHERREDNRTTAATNGVGPADVAHAQTDFVIGRIVTMEWLQHHHIRHSAAPGPFASSHEWTIARLDHLRQASQHTLRTSTDEADLDDARTINRTAERMLEVLPLVFPLNCPDPEAFVLTHDDLSDHNILVDGSGALTAVLDWECVSTLPLWRSCQLPAFLQGRERLGRPIQADYSVGPDGTVDQLFWDHLMDFERTELRRIFLQEMGQMEPAWVEVHRATELQMDFDWSIQRTADGLFLPLIQRWLENLAQGGPRWGLRARVMG